MTIQNWLALFSEKTWNWRESTRYAKRSKNTHGGVSESCNLSIPPRWRSRTRSLMRLCANPACKPYFNNKEALQAMLENMRDTVDQIRWLSKFIKHDSPLFQVIEKRRRQFIKEGAQVAAWLLNKKAALKKMREPFLRGGYIRARWAYR